MLSCEFLLSSAIEMARAAGDVQLEYFRSKSLTIGIKQNESDVCDSCR